MVKMRLESGDDVNQRDQVKVLSRVLSPTLSPTSGVRFSSRFFYSVLTLAATH